MLSGILCVTRVPILTLICIKVNCETVETLGFCSPKFYNCSCYLALVSMYFSVVLGCRFSLPVLQSD